MFLCLSCPSATFGLWHGSFEAHERRAIARFFLMGVGGGGDIITSAKGLSLLKGSGSILPQENFKFGGSKMLFSALVMRYVSQKLTSNKCEKVSVFSAYFEGSVYLKHTVYPSTKQIHPQT